MKKLLVIMITLLGILVFLDGCGCLNSECVRATTQTKVTYIDTYAIRSPTVTHRSLEDVLEAVDPAVVQLFIFNESVFRDELLFQQHTTTWAGSGVVVNANEGYIVTNAHMIYGAHRIIVTLGNGTKLDAYVIGADYTTDVGLIKISDMSSYAARHMTQINIVDSSKLRIGQTVYVIGNPFDIGLTVTRGIVSALGGNRLKIGDSYFIQTDAAINHGNSGGALIDQHGDLIGVTSAIFSPNLGGGSAGIGFAIPSNIVVKSINDIIHDPKGSNVVGTVVEAVPWHLLESDKKLKDTSDDNGDYFPILLHNQLDKLDKEDDVYLS